MVEGHDVPGSARAEELRARTAEAGRWFDDSLLAWTLASLALASPFFVAAARMR